MCCLPQSTGRELGSEGLESPTRGSAAGGEVTEALLAEGEEEGAASIVRVYAALLLGFLAVATNALRQACAFPSLAHAWLDFPAGQGSQLRKSHMQALAGLDPACSL